MMRLVWRMYTMRGFDVTTLWMNITTSTHDTTTPLQWINTVMAFCVFQPCTSGAGTQPDLATSIKVLDERKRKWDSDAPPSKLRDDLLTKIFMSTGMSTEFLDNPDVRNYHQITDEKYNLPGLCVCQHTCLTWSELQKLKDCIPVLDHKTFEVLLVSLLQ